jgi:nitroimidazol reductase NimA-like FMN-containing flavoprotein (pyridoxamine 5'-phosphate oxidase superfamily)
MGRADIRMSPEEIETFLDGGLKAQIATNGSDGFPHLTTLWYVVEDGRIVFRSFTKSQRIVNLRRDDRITALVEDGTGYDELRGVMVRGHARLEDEPRRVLDVYRRVLSKATGTDVPSEQAEALFGRFAAKNTVVTVVPTSVTSWDHATLGGAY